MDEILQQYEVRKSNKEKTAFIEYMKQRLSDAGYEVNVEEKGKGLLKSRNIVVGNVKEAQVVFTAHYDTCAVLPFPNLMAPTSVFLFTISQILITVLIFAMAIGAAIGFSLLTGDIIPGGLVCLLFLYVFLFYMLFGYRNKHTANDNTSGVITITKILEKLPEEDRNKVCVVYFDNEEKGLLGSSFFKTKHQKEMAGKFLVNFDCVGDGKTVVALAKKEMQEDALYKQYLDAMNEHADEYEGEFIHEKMRPLMFGSDQMHFKRGIGVCALRKSPLGMYVARIHTPFDTICREENVEYISNGAVTFLNRITGECEKCEYSGQKKPDRRIAKRLCFVFLLMLAGILLSPVMYEYRCKTRCYDDMNDSITEEVLKSNIVIVGREEAENSENVTHISYGAGASGVIFAAEENTYYVLTAYHVVANAENTDYFILPYGTPTYSEIREESETHIPLEEYYEQFEKASVVYADEEYDLAVISFVSKEPLNTIEIGETNPVYKERIAVISNPEGERFVNSFGKINDEDYYLFDPDEMLAVDVYKHNAYIAPGSSGSVVLNDRMEIVGINIGGGTDFLHRFKCGYMVPCEMIQEFLNNM